MSILIKGMEMPKNCLDCPLTDGHSVECTITQKSVYSNVEKRHGDCPLKELPKGKWIKNEGKVGWHCSECKETNIYAYKWSSDIGKKELQDKYCPNCGADMKSSAQEDD